MECPCTKLRVGPREKNLPWYEEYPNLNKMCYILLKDTVKKKDITYDPIKIDFSEFDTEFIKTLDGLCFALEVNMWDFELDELNTPREYSPVISTLPKDLKVKLLEAIYKNFGKIDSSLCELNIEAFKHIYLMMHCVVETTCDKLNLDFEKYLKKLNSIDLTLEDIDLHSLSSINALLYKISESDTLRSLGVLPSLQLSKFLEEELSFSEQSIRNLLFLRSSIMYNVFVL